MHRRNLQDGVWEALLWHDGTHWRLYVKFDSSVRIVSRVSLEQNRFVGEHCPGATPPNVGEQKTISQSVFAIHMEPDSKLCRRSQVAAQRIG